METGGCLCGKIRYKFNRERVVSSGHCHCSDCQRATGSGKATIIFVPTEDLEISIELIAHDFEYAFKKEMNTQIKSSLKDLYTLLVKVFDINFLSA